MVTGICEHFEPVDALLERRADTVVVVVFGEIDLSCSDRLNARLREMIGSARLLILDLSDVSFMDVSGLHCVLDAHHASHAAGVEFALVPGPPTVQRLFQVTKTDGVLRFIGARSQA